MSIDKPQGKKSWHIHSKVGAALAAIIQYQGQSRLKPLLRFIQYKP